MTEKQINDIIDELEVTAGGLERIITDAQMELNNVNKLIDKFVDMLADAEPEEENHYYLFMSDETGELLAAQGATLVEAKCNLFRKYGTFNVCYVEEVSKEKLDRFGFELQR